jgi:MFS family permease
MSYFLLVVKIWKDEDYIMNINKPTKLLNRNFIKYLIALEFNMMASAILTFALPLYFLIYTGNATLLGTVLTISTIPQVLASPLGGIVGDRFSRRKLMAGTNILIAIVTIIYLLVASRLSFVPTIIIFLLLVESFVAFINPAQEATIPSIVPEKDLMKANSINFLLSIFSGVGSPILAGFIMASHGLRPILFIVIGLSLIAGILNYFVTIPLVEQGDSPTNLFALLVNDLVAGFKFTMKNSIIHRKIIISLTFYNMVVWPIIGIILPVIVTNYFHFGESINGIIRGIVIFGASFGVIIAGKLGDRVNIYQLGKITIYSGVALIPTIASFLIWGDNILSLIFLVISLFTVWTLFTIYILVIWTYIGTETPMEMMGKTFAVTTAVSSAGPVLTNQLYGWLMNIFTASPYMVLIIIAIALFLVAVFTRLPTKAIKQI